MMTNSYVTAKPKQIRLLVTRRRDIFCVVKCLLLLKQQALGIISMYFFFAFCTK